MHHTFLSNQENQEKSGIHFSLAFIVRAAKRKLGKLMDVALLHYYCLPSPLGSPVDAHHHSCMKYGTND